jgi:kumamolisin
LKYVTLSKSKRQQPVEARPLGKSNGDEHIHITVVVRPASSGNARLKAIQELTSKLPRNRTHLNLGEFTKFHGASDEDLALVKRFARENGFRVIDESKARRCVVLSGSIRKLSATFQVSMMNYMHAGHTYRSHTDAIQIPSHLERAVDAVLGFDDRPLMNHHAFLLRQHAVQHIDPSKVMNTYHFPADANGKEQSIAIIELGGGFYKKDINDYFRALRLQVPKIKVIEILGQRNNPAPHEAIEKLLKMMGISNIHRDANTNANQSDLVRASWTIESTLDIQLTGAFANAAAISVFFAPNNAQGKYHALTSALMNSTTLISCSWGAVEEDLPLDFVDVMNDVFLDAALLGTTVCFSSGDHGDDPAKNGKPRAHFPATSPYVLACGGTHWGIQRKKFSEVVWNETFPTYAVKSGGGISSIFKSPHWQSSARIKLKTHKNGRGIPDVAGKADIERGYSMQVAGYNITMGGTSAVAPMWAGLIARMNEKLGCRVGYLTPLLYQKIFHQTCTDITKGNNGKHYKAGPGWDACTGWGTPNGKRLLAALKGKKT